MLTKVACPPAWKQQGYVCLACRHSQRTQAHQRHQRRCNTRPAHTSATPVEDEFISHFNSIGETYADSPKLPFSKTSDLSRIRKEVPAQQSSTTRVNHEKTTAHSVLDEIFPSSKTSRWQEQQRDSPVTKSKEHDITSSKHVRASQIEIDWDSSQIQAVPQREIQKFDPPEGVDHGNRVHELITDLQDRAVTRASHDSKPASRNDPLAADDSLTVVPQRKISREDAGTARFHKASIERGVKVYRAKTSPYASGLGGPVPQSDTSRSSNGARGHATKKARPGFGVVETAANGTTSGASFSSFRNADRISPDKPIPTAVAGSPFGIIAPRAEGKGSAAASLTSVDQSPSSLGYLLRRVKAAFGFKVSAESIAASSKDRVPQEGHHEHAVERDSDQPINDLKSGERNVGGISMEDMDQFTERKGNELATRLGHTGSGKPKKGAPEVDDLAHARLTNLHSLKVMQAESQSRPTDTDVDDTMGADSKTAQDRHAAQNPTSQTRGSSKPPTIRRLMTGRPSSPFAHPSDMETTTNLTHNAGSASAATPSGTSTGSANVGSGDDGSDGPSDDLSGMSIIEAMKSSRQPRKRRARTKQQQGEQTPAKNELPKESGEEQGTQAGQSTSLVSSITPSQLHIEPLDVPQPHVPYLEYGLDRVLFNPGVYHLQDPVSRVYNFDPYLQHIMPVSDFDFNSLKEYKTSSQDVALSTLAKTHEKKYIGSTSSMTSSLAHFHYLLSNWRPINLRMLSHEFVSPTTKTNMTEINRAPSAIFLRWKNGTYAIDADKEYDGANVLMLLGKSMELLLTQPKSEFERYRKSDPRTVSEEQKTSPESYQYTTMRDFLMRSQLDAYDPRLPGNGTFDLKTRAVVSVRMQAKEFEPMTGYELFSLRGKWNSYEREYYDMMRSTMLKYMLQARMGRMDGIFVAYHNVKRIFGFQYIPMHELDWALHGQLDTCLGDQEFKASLDMLNEVMNKATAKFPEQSLRFHFETQEAQSSGMPTALHVFAEPMSEETIDRIQNTGKAKVAAFEREIMGKDTDVDPETVETESLLNATPEPSKEKQLASTHEEDSSTTSSDSHADVKFLSSIEESSSEELKPLFYATIIVQSRVNGEIPSGDRPFDLKAGDKWEIDYILKEYDIGRHQWALYEDTKARRKFKFSESREDEDEGDPESEGQSKRQDGYIQMLRGLANKSRQARIHLDKMDAGKEPVLAEQPLSRDREKIQGVEDYMSWLYRPKEGEA